MLTKQLTLDKASLVKSFVISSNQGIRTFLNIHHHLKNLQCVYFIDTEPFQLLYIPPNLRSAILTTKLTQLVWSEKIDNCESLETISLYAVSITKASTHIQIHLTIMFTEVPPDSFRLIHPINSITSLRITGPLSFIYSTMPNIKNTLVGMILDWELPRLQSITIDSICSQTDVVNYVLHRHGRNITNLSYTNYHPSELWTSVSASLCRLTTRLHTLQTTFSVLSTYDQLHFPCLHTVVLETSLQFPTAISSPAQRIPTFNLLFDKAVFPELKRVIIQDKANSNPTFLFYAYDKNTEEVLLKIQARLSQSDIVIQNSHGMKMQIFLPTRSTARSDRGELLA